MAETIVGRKPILEALKAGTAIEKIAVLPGLQGRLIEEIRTLAEKQNIPVQELDHQRFRALAGNMKTQGMIAILAHSYTYSTIEAILARAASRSEQPFLLILDEIEDPHNLGALIRTAEAVGAHGVVIPLARAVEVTPAVVNASSGASEHMLIAQANLSQTIDSLKAENVWVAGLDQAGAEIQPGSRHLKGALALVVGSEGEGLRELVRKKCDIVLKLPMRGKVESLNAAVAGSVALYLAYLSRK